jgi:hypothetical protein
MELGFVNDDIGRMLGLGYVTGGSTEGFIRNLQF